VTATLSLAELEFHRPATLGAASPPEVRGVPRDQVRLLVSDSAGHRHAHFRDLPGLLEPGDLLVVNESATLPASLPAAGRLGEFRLNLSTRYADRLWLAEPRWSAARPGPMAWLAGDVVRAAGVTARFVAPYPWSSRLWYVRFDGDVMAAAGLLGEPIRYGYLEAPYPPLDAYQTIFATVPGSAEMPSAARPFTLGLVESLRWHGIRFASIVLHCGVSSLEVETPELDPSASPPEPFSVPPETAAAVTAARERGSRVIAVGTTVVRALESAAQDGVVRATRGFTRRIVRPGLPPKVVNGLITGLHDPRTTHLALLYALAGSDRIREAYALAISEGYMWHEFGDAHLIVHRRARRGR
jgi:S-adenosylmethionine:tRNA ribosyltransferase-isomerase